jgi:hypothetical protein
MEINDYLNELSLQLVLSASVKEKIDRSTEYLKKKIWGLFQARLSDCLVIGSYDRNTMIPVDDDLDIDLLISFKKNEYQPDTYFRQIKSFCEQEYPKSIVYQDHPTVALELDHIKFELIPAMYQTTGVKIPAPRSTELKWIFTNPEAIKNRVQEKDNKNKGLILPVIRILKYWNINSDRPFSSYALENAIVSKLYDCSSLRDYYFSASKALEDLASSEQQKTAIVLLKEKNRRLRALQREKLTEYIKPEFDSFLPFI